MSILIIWSISFVQSQFQVPNSDWYVTDLVNIISDEQENDLESKIYDFWQKTDVEVWLLLISSTSWDDIWYVAQQVAEGWWIWDLEKDNWLLILIAVDDRQRRIHVGYWLEWTITDFNAKKIWEENFPYYFRQWDYYGWISAVLNRIQEYILNDEELLNSTVDSYEYEQKTPWWFILWIIYFIVGFFLISNFVIEKKSESKWSKKSVKKKIKSSGWLSFSVISILMSVVLFLFGVGIIGSLIQSFIIMFLDLWLFMIDWSSTGSYSGGSSSSTRSSSYSSGSSSSYSSSSSSFWWFGGGSFGGWWASGSW